MELSKKCCGIFFFLIGCNWHFPKSFLTIKAVSCKALCIYVWDEICNTASIH